MKGIFSHQLKEFDSELAQQTEKETDMEEKGDDQSDYASVLEDM